jgi:ubiquinone/menaquinone biosynthesis C-methylase UbiE
VDQPAAAYVLGGTASEQERLVAQAADFTPQARWLIDQLGIPPGARVVDVGCGPIGILPELAQAVGPAGVVIGVERESRFVRMAKDEVRSRALPQVRIVQGDGLALGLEAGSFDVAHERLVLINLPQPARMLAELRAIVRPGGIVAAEEIDSVSWVCEPPHPAWTRLFDAFHAVFRANGLDPFFGRRLPGLLQAAGLRDVRVEVHSHLDQLGEYRRTHLLSLVGSIRGRLVEQGAFTEAELTELLDALGRHLADPATVVVRQLLFQAWGRVPG